MGEGSTDAMSTPLTPPPISSDTPKHEKRAEAQQQKPLYTLPDNFNIPSDSPADTGLPASDGLRRRDQK